MVAIRWKWRAHIRHRIWWIIDDGGSMIDDRWLMMMMMTWWHDMTKWHFNGWMFPSSVPEIMLAAFTLHHAVILIQSLFLSACCISHHFCEVDASSKCTAGPCMHCVHVLLPHCSRSQSLACLTMLRDNADAALRHLMLQPLTLTLSLSLSLSPPDVALLSSVSCCLASPVSCLSLGCAPHVTLFSSLLFSHCMLPQSRYPLAHLSFPLPGCRARLLLLPVSPPVPLVQHSCPVSMYWPWAYFWSSSLPEHQHKQLEWWSK